LNDIVENQISQKADISSVFNKNEVLNQLSTKQDVIGNDDLLISNIKSLQSILDSKQGVLSDHNAIKIQQVENLQGWLNAMAYKENVYYINEVDNLLSQKQSVLHDNSLTINMTSGLEEALNSKQHVIKANDLSISQVANLRESLDSKCDKTNYYTNQDVDVKVSNLVEQVQTQLQDKYDKVDVYSKLETDTIASTKQNVIGANSLSMNMVHGLEDYVNSKQDRLPSQNALSMDQVTGLTTTLNNKVDVQAVYKKSEVNTLIAQAEQVINNIDKTIIGLGNVDNVAVSNMALEESQITGLVDNLQAINTSLKKKMNNHN